MSSINTQFGYNFVISVIISGGGGDIRGWVDTFRKVVTIPMMRPHGRRLLPLFLYRKGGMRMVTYEALFAFCLVIISIVALFKDNKK